MEWFTFKAASEHLGIEAQYIYRVVDDVQIAPVPLLPACHMGLIYYRGEFFHVVHMGSLLGQDGGKSKEKGWIILIKWSDKKLALVADKVIGLLWIEDHDRAQSIYTQGDYTVRLVTPEDIWSNVVRLAHDWNTGLRLGERDFPGANRNSP